MIVYDTTIQPVRAVIKTGLFHYWLSMEAMVEFLQTNRPSVTTISKTQRVYYVKTQLQLVINAVIIFKQKPVKKCYSCLKYV